MGIANGTGNRRAGAAIHTHIRRRGVAAAAALRNALFSMVSRRHAQLIIKR